MDCAVIYALKKDEAAMICNFVFLFGAEGGT